MDVVGIRERADRQAQVTGDVGAKRGFRIDLVVAAELAEATDADVLDLALALLTDTWPLGETEDVFGGQCLVLAVTFADSLRLARALDGFGQRRRGYQRRERRRCHEGQETQGYDSSMMG